ncbi:hypothetical protein LJC25_02480 [Bacteroidales bacterium OttesenSCG-928-K03]|nr:hypothetical protein [Bacteroidales bacterium OttesenSCG-928-K22]MDL2242575.1 hypothetical protein [Bacteroidales bacterium OttesenSCG-928-K03]
MSNFPNKDTVVLDMDLSDAVTNGIFIPTVNQTESGYFEYNFRFSKAGNKKYYYKIFYQNESYKFGISDSLNYENFYGSWEDTSIGFLPIEEDEVNGKIRIVGNPRDEKQYYGADISSNNFSEAKLNGYINSMKNNKDWYESIVQKANKNNNTVEKQLYKDALWMINDARNRGNENNRWKRNPRVGNYSFYLVICDEENLDKIPDHIKYINQRNQHGQFENPIFWFEKNVNSIAVEFAKSDRVLKTRAVITPQKGIFVDGVNVPSMDYHIDTNHCYCGDDEKLYKSALFQQFFSAVSKQYSLRNIPLIQDVVGGDNPYTMQDYLTQKNNIDSTKLLYNYPVTSDKPCSSVKVSEEGDYISIINPGNDDINNLRKESTGIKTRVGFTYGKYRGKIKFPEMLNDDNVWNGLTYAFWLIYQDNHEWNHRRGCYTKGYVEKGDDTKDPIRSVFNKYSEIDIEIVKASKYWPTGYYKGTKLTEDAKQNNEVAFCCTNWDLACPAPEKFSSGITSIPYNNTSYDALRWYETYKALTIRNSISNEVFKEDYYYYEIEWKPTEIIWRIGPSPENMQVVGYMNDKYTSIPNNQMLAIITQEYHYSEWWPPIVFEQGLIPYNKTDIEGKVYEIVIE